MSQKNAPPSVPPGAAAGQGADVPSESNTLAKSVPPGAPEPESRRSPVPFAPFAPSASAPPPPAGAARIAGPPRAATFARPSTPTAFTPVASPIADLAPEDDDDAPTMGPTPLLNLDALPPPSPAASAMRSPRPQAPPAPPPGLFAPIPPLAPPHAPPHAPPAAHAAPPPHAAPAVSSRPAALALSSSGAMQASPTISSQMQVAIRTDAPRPVRSTGVHVLRSRAYSFSLDARGMPIEVGSGRFAKAYLGEERWIESKTDFRREVVIKILQRGVSDDDHLRFQMEKELLERVQGHPSIVHLFASGEGEDPEFVPPSIRDQVENEFVILERMEMSLEERLKGSRGKARKEDLLALDMRERIFRVLDYMIPIASAVEYAHLVRNVSHRDIKPANVLIRLPDATLRGSILEVRLADFNVAKLNDDEIDFGVTRMKSVPGTLFFQSPEQETNTIELLVNCQQGSPEVEFFEDFYIHIAKNDTFALFNRDESYPILYADRVKKRIVLARPYRDVNETNVRAKVQKSVGRPADIYSLGALFYYLITGAYGNPKTLYDAFHKFIEYERADESNTIEAYLEHEYSVIQQLASPKPDQAGEQVEVAPADRFFSYKQYLDGNGDLIDPFVMKIIAKCMIRNKPDSYCQAHEVDTRGISSLMSDLIDLYSVYGAATAARPGNIARRGQGLGALMRPFHQSRMRLWWRALRSAFARR